MMEYNIKNPKPTPDKAKLEKMFNYDPETGILTWRYTSRPDLIGMQCGSISSQGYHTVTINGSKFGVHRIIYKMMTNEEPDIMDHINGKRHDNRWCNLRSVSHQENNFNIGLAKDNKSGFSGVHYRADHDRYTATVRIGSKSHHLGSFKTKAEAIAARQAANIILGFSERHGKVA
jgi:hypothetical protein